MAAPAPHTPVNFLKAGGSAFFSIRCQKAIMDLGWDPDEFGTYDSTLSHIRKCREKVKKDPSSCTARERELGEPYYEGSGDDRTVNPDAYTSGHMFLNSSMQGQRGSDCDNYVPGYSMGGCPSMPHQGQTHDQGTQHNRHTVREYAGAIGDGPHEAGGPYGGTDQSPDQALTRAKQDAKDRARALVQERREQLAQQQSEQQGAGSDSDGGAAADSGDAAAAGSADAGSPTAPTAPKEHQVDGETAGECLENFTEMGFNGMQQKCKDDISKNEAAAGGAEPPTQAKLAVEEAGLASARGSLGATARKVNNGTATQAEYDAQRATYDEQKAKLDGMRGGSNEAACRAAQGRALRDGTSPPPPGDRGPRQPGNAGANVPGTSASGIETANDQDDESFD